MPIIKNRTENKKVELNENLKMYLSQEKDWAVSMAWSILPGGGHFYAENYLIGSIFVAARLGTLFWAIDGAQYGDYGNWNMFALSTILDIGLAPITVRAYNKNLKLKYNVTFSTNQPMLGVNIEF